MREDLYDASSTSSCPFQYTYVDMDLNFFHYTYNNVNYTLLFERGPLLGRISYLMTLEIFEEIMCSKEGNYQFAYLVLCTKVVDFDVLKCKKNVFVHSLYTSFTSKLTVEQGFEISWSGGDDEEKCHGCMKYGG